MKPYRILKTFKGSQDGIDGGEFEAGGERLLSDSLAEVAVREGWATPIPIEEPPAEAAESPVEAKAAEPAEEDKALSVPENKARGRKKQS